MFQFITVTMEKYFINRLLDMAHSRYRPGIALRYKALYSEQKTFTDIKQLRDSIYLIVENKPGVGILEFMVDMDIGICSCSLGTSGAPCKHQGAVARKFNICSVNLAPSILRKQGKHLPFWQWGKATLWTWTSMLTSEPRMLHPYRSPMYRHR